MKKVLIISYYWPPAGGISVQRSLKIAKYLREYGWEPVIYTAKNAHYPYYDESNFEHVPDDVQVIKRGIIEPFALFKFLSGKKKDDPLNNIVHVRSQKQSFIDKFGIWIRGNFFIPDARALWIKPSVRYLVKFLKNNPVDAIFSDGPPHTNTMIACQLKLKTGLPWLADFQDPWTQVDYYQLLKIGKRADRKHKKLEQLVFKTADRITIVSNHWKKDLEQIGAKNVFLAYWGYDEDDFKDAIPKQDQSFTITHVGILGFDRSPVALIRILAHLCKTDNDFKNDLKIKLIGQVDYSVREQIREHGLEANSHMPGTIPRKEAIKEMMNSWVLLLLLNKSRNVLGRMPGKCFEYLRSRRPILCLGPNESEAGGIISSLNAGDIIEYDNDEGIKSSILKYYDLFKKGNFASVKSDITDFSIKDITGTIAKQLDEISS